ncbi:MAG TPA: site-specific integrase [Segetibacter sp.]
MKIEISRCLDLRYKTKNNTYPICVRLYYNRKYSYINTGEYLTKNDYDDLFASKIRSQLKGVLKNVVETETLVSAYLSRNSIFDIKALRKHLAIIKGDHIIEDTLPVQHSSNVFDWFDIKIQSLKLNKQFGSAESYQSTKSVFLSYLGLKDIPFTFFTVEILKKIEIEFMETRKLEISTVGKHARNLRAIFKMALNEEVISLKDYPFGRYRYIIPEVTKSKKSLSRKMLASLMNYTPESYYESRAIAYFIFSYFGNGMNLKDMALLKFKDMKGDKIYFYRKKTKNTTSKLKMITVHTTPEMKKVLNDFGNQNTSPEDYLFSIITSGMSEETVNTKVHTRSKTINNSLKRISKKLDFDTPITLGMARHSFANALKQEGVSINFIQESLGHGLPSTTEHYLKSFEDAISIEHIDKLKKYYS